MATADRLGQKQPSSDRELVRAKSAIVNPRPIRLVGVLGPAQPAVGSGTFKERIQIGGVTTVTVIAKFANLSGVNPLSIHGMTSPSTEEDTDGAERNGRLATLASPVDGINELASFTPAGEEWIEVELVVAGDLDIEWVEVLGQ